MKWFAVFVVGLTMSAVAEARAQVPATTANQPGVATVEVVRWARPYRAYARPYVGYRYGYANPYRVYRPYYGYRTAYPYGAYYRGNVWYGGPRAYPAYRYW